MPATLPQHMASASAVVISAGRSFTMLKRLDFLPFRVSARPCPYGPGTWYVARASRLAGSRFVARQDATVLQSWALVTIPGPASPRLASRQAWRLAPRRLGSGASGPGSSAGFELKWGPRGADGKKGICQLGFVDRIRAPSPIVGSLGSAPIVRPLWLYHNSCIQPWYVSTRLRPITSQS